MWISISRVSPHLHQSSRAANIMAHAESLHSIGSIPEGLGFAQYCGTTIIIVCQTAAASPLALRGPFIGIGAPLYGLRSFTPIPQNGHQISLRRCYPIIYSQTIAFDGD